MKRMINWPVTVEPTFERVQAQIGYCLKRHVTLKKVFDRSKSGKLKIELELKTSPVSMGMSNEEYSKFISKKLVEHFL